jgi:cellulose synthase/poly-beta-1,6-N-acetylglucosamine synthase-like glycosyltransferase
VGRGPTADIVILDKLASRNHCELRHSGTECLIADLESLNGTYLNGNRITRGALKEGDRISIGSTHFEFRVGEAEEDSTASAGAEGPVVRCARCEAVLAEKGRFLQNSVEMGSETYCAPCGSHVRIERERLGQPMLPSTIHPEGSTILGPPGGPPAARDSVFAPVAARKPSEARPGVLHPDPTVDNFLRKNYHDAANIVVTRTQKVWYLSLAVLLLVLFAYDYLHFLHLTHLLCSFYLVVIFYKLACVGLSLLKRMDIRISAAEIEGLKDENLPGYTILVPLYKETEVAEKIVRNISALDYPSDKLDVKLLLEEDDAATIEACRRANLPPHFQTIVVPHSKPKTKPKACNHGLKEARAEYLVIYDAEDRPEPDQLKKAVCAFTNKVDAKTICLQAKLNYFNPRQNLLTKWFTIEYTTWFDLYLPGLHALGAPIPLGGTSNHFRTEVLREIGGWDPFNVTEDCDLGIRLYRMGYKTQILDSTTWEEANSKLYNWIRQRSRWVKGYVQTHLVHMRRPLRTLWDLGLWRFFGFLVSVGGLALTLLLNPIFWFIVALYVGLWTVHQVSPDLWIYGQHVKPWRMVYPLTEEYDYFWSMVSIVFFGLTSALFLGNFFFVFTHVFACFRRGLLDLLPHALLMPIYWILISIGAWKGFLQLLYKPFYWEKTVHGLDSKAPVFDLKSSPVT